MLCLLCNIVNFADLLGKKSKRLKPMATRALQLDPKLTADVDKALGHQATENSGNICNVEANREMQ